jgi:DNA-binding GntR family transcriptional regulator
MAASSELGYRSKADLVTEHLRSELQEGRPRPGQRLVVSQVAERLGVSKVPVREAVTRLVGEGLLVHRANVGPMVPDFSAHEIVETALMRVALESAALPSALSGHTADTVSRLGATLERMRAADADFPRLNVEFHAQVIAPTPYRELYAAAHALLARAQRYAFVHTVPGYRPHAHEEHVAILRAVEDRDLHALEDLNRTHIMSAAEQLADHIGRGQDDGLEAQ